MFDGALEEADPSALILVTYPWRAVVSSVTYAFPWLSTPIAVG